MSPCLRVLPLFFAALLPAQRQIAFVEGNDASSLQLRVVDERNAAGGGRIVKSGMRLLNLDFTMRTVQQTLDPTVPRRVVEFGIARIDLPRHGRLYHYRLAGGEFGYLRIDPEGSVQTLLELPGPVGNPFADRIAVSGDGRHAAFTTALGALYLARLDGRVFASTGSPVRAIATAGPVDPVSVAIGRRTMFFHTEDDRIWRAPLADGATPVNVTPAGTPAAILKEEMTLAGDGRSVAFLYGPKEFQRIYQLWETGPAIVLPPPAAKYEEPGYLPEEPLGPRMMLNHDGSRLLYTDSTNREEIFLLDTTGTWPVSHLTSDANLQPYIGVGIMPSFFGTTLWIAIGDLGAFDWFTATTESNGITNLTQTAQEVLPPYGAGTLVPTNGYRTAGGFLAEELDGAGGKVLRLLDTAGGESIFAAGVSGAMELGRVVSPEALPWVGEGEAAWRQAPPTVVMRTAVGDAVLSPALQVHLSSVAGVSLSTEHRGSDGVSVLCASIATGFGVPILRWPDGTIVALPADPNLMKAQRTDRGVVVNGTRLEWFGPGSTVVISAQPYRRILS